MSKVGIYPGTFDPITFGHLDIIKRSLKVVDKLLVAVAIDSSKKTLFSAEERVSLIEYEIANSKKINKENVEVVSFNGLLINFAHQRSADIIIRGLRAVSDFEYEFQMSCMNSKLDKEIQTIFLPSSAKLQLVSSKLVKEVVKLGGMVNDFASENVQQKLKEYFDIANEL